MGSNEVIGVFTADFCVINFLDVSFGALAKKIVEPFNVAVEGDRDDPVEKVAK